MQSMAGGRVVTVVSTPIELDGHWTFMLAGEQVRIAI